MNCATCKVNKIGPNTAPYGGYMCDNEHLQCNQCNIQSNGQCGTCNGGTGFVQMNFNIKKMGTKTTTTTTKMTSTTAQVMPTPSSDDLAASSNENNQILIKTHSSYEFPKSFFADMDTQSSISQEQLSMQDSHEPSTDNGDDTDQRAFELIEKPPMLNKSFTKIQTPPPLLMSQSQMETLYFIKNQQRYQSSFAFRQSNNEQELKDVENRSKNLKHEKSANIVPKESGGNMKKNPVDPNAIHTSELRFIQSTESLQNYFSGGTLPTNPKPNTNTTTTATKQETTNPTMATAAATTTTTATTTENAHQTNATANQTGGLSVSLLRDFEGKNTANPTEFVENYLRNYGPLTVCHFPAYSFNHNCFHPSSASADGWMPSPANRPNNLRSISVSTESEPALGTFIPKQQIDNAGKYPHQDFFVMQATGIPEPVPGTIPPSNDKIECPSIDIRMQKVLETFHEDPRQSKVSEKPLLEQTMNYIKIPTPEPLSLEPNVPATIEQQSSIFQLPDKSTDSQDIINQLSQSHRAYYNPPNDVSAKVRQKYHNREPPPQFQLISCSKLISNELLLAKTRYINMKAVQACQLNIERSPIKCPDATCQRMIFVSDFNKHLVVDHNKLPMERIAPRQCKNFFLDPRLSHAGFCKCHLLYLIRDKITDLGSSKFKDFLPLLVMSSRVKLGDLVGGPSADNPALYDDDLDFLMIWLTGIVPDEIPVSTSLTVWPRTGHVPKCHLVHSGEVYSIRKSQSAVDVWRSGQMMLLSANEINMLTNDGKEMLELQIVVH